MSEPSESGPVSIAYLKTLAAGRSTFISNDIYIEGCVVAHDWLGEFYKTMTVVDDSGGIEISIDSRRIWQLLPLHSSITVSCNGLTLGRYGNKLQLGTESGGDYPTERIAEYDFDRYISVSGEASMPDPLELEVGELTTAHISRFVCFRNLQLSDEERGAVWCNDTDENTDDDDTDDDRYLKFTDRHFVDTHGDTLTVRVLNRCDYAKEPIPSGRLVLAGIADADGSTPLLRIANRYVWPM